MFKKITRRILKTILWLVAILIAMDLLIVTLIIIPPIQQFVVLKASKILTHTTGGEITVDKIYLSPNLTLTAKNFAIKDHHHENMIFASKLKGRINLAKTSKGQVCLSFAQLDDGEVMFRKYKGEDKVNIAIWAQGFKKEVKKEPKFKLLFENIILNDVRFVVILDEKRLFKDDNTIDYAFFELQHIHLDVDNFLVFGPDISCKINSLTLSQHTGFTISSFSGDFRIYPKGLLLNGLKFKTPNSSFFGDFAFQYDDFPDYSDFVNKINFDTQIKSASISMQDIVYFVPKLKGMDSQLVLSGYVGGSVNHLQTKGLYLKYKEQTHMVGDFAIDNILDFHNCSFNLRMKDAQINFSELAQLTLPGGQKMNLPPFLDRVTYTILSGNYQGSLTKFNANILLQTNLGTAAVDLKTIPQGSLITYSGNIDCNALDLATLLSQSKYLNKVSLHSSFEGDFESKGALRELFSSISIQAQGKIFQLDLCGYGLKEIQFKGNYHQKDAYLAMQSHDPLATFAVKGNINFAINTPKIDAVLGKINIKLFELFSHYPLLIDSCSAKGFDKFILKVQQNPNLAFTVDSVAIDLTGNNLDNFNGFVRVDYAKLTNGVKSSRIDRLRLTAINVPNAPHHYMLHSNAVNISLKTNFNYKDAIAAVSDAAEYYIPTIFKDSSAIENNIAALPAEPFIDADLEFFYSQNLFNLIFPKLNMASNTLAKIHLGATRTEDLLHFSSPRITYLGLGRVNNIKLNGKMNEAKLLALKLQCDSVSIYQKKGEILTFSDIEVTTLSNNKEIRFATSWRNPKGFSINEKNNFNGILYGDASQNPSLKITDSKLFIRESQWQFIGDKNIITYCNKDISIDHCVLSSQIGTVSVNGELSKQLHKKCNILLENLDISLLNSLTARMRMSFAGNMSLMAVITGKEDSYGIDGKTFIKNFEFNGEKLGDLFLDAFVVEEGDPHFIGGILSSSSRRKIDLTQFSYNNYLALPDRIIELTGKFDTKAKDLYVHACMDTLKIGFLSPFLDSFSHVVEGDASGELDFIMTPDSLYFDGKVKIKKAKLGIAPLNTIYNITNQEILFDSKGITFNKIIIKDKFNNDAILSGYVHHTKFKDFIIDLNISTKKIMALNTPKKMDTPFFGDGFVSGDIFIQGDTKQLNFSSQNMKTLPGSTITFPITSASTVSETKGIYFITSNLSTEKNIENKKKSSTIMNFDFVFDITRDADVKLELDPIDGILKCKTLGKLHLLYNSSTGNMDLNGILSIVSGQFHMSLKNLFPRDFTIVEGGTITFAGPLSRAQINVTALYQKTASLNSLNPEFGRTEVDAFLGLNGDLMNPGTSFKFDFPRLTNEDKFEVFNALDTANQQNGIRQFFSFVFLNTFITSESAPDASPQMGIDFATNMLNSILSGQLKNVNIGVNYVNSVNNQDNSTNNIYREYSVNAAVNFYNDKMRLKTNLGLGQDNSSGENKNSFVGDASFEYDLSDNWLLNVFYFNEKTNNSNLGRPDQGGGISFKYKQDFNNKKDFVEPWKVKKKEKKQKTTP